MAGNDLSGIQVPTSPSPLPFLPYFCLPPSHTPSLFYSHTPSYTPSFPPSLPPSPPSLSLPLPPSPPPLSPSSLTDPGGGEAMAYTSQTGGGESVQEDGDAGARDDGEPFLSLPLLTTCVASIACLPAHKPLPLPEPLPSGRVSASVLQLGPTTSHPSCSPHELQGCHPARHSECSGPNHPHGGGR